MTGKKQTDKDKPHHAREPQASYNKKLVFFNSLEEMEEYDLRHMARFTPTENFCQVTELLRHFFSKELKKPMTDLLIRYK